MVEQIEKPVEGYTEKPAAEPAGKPAENAAVVTIKRSYVNFALIAIVFLAIGWFLGSNIGTAQNTGGSTGTGSLAPQLKLDLSNYNGMQKNIVAGVPVLGNPDAPISIVEYSDFQCPYCERFHSQALEASRHN